MEGGGGIYGIHHLTDNQIAVLFSRVLVLCIGSVRNTITRGCLKTHHCTINVSLTITVLYFTIQIELVFFFQVEAVKEQDRLETVIEKEMFAGKYAY